MKRSLWLGLALLAGCSPKIPPKVETAEYELYSAWMQNYFKKAPEGTLYLSARTFAWPDACDQIMKKAGVDSGLVAQLSSLGEAEYPMELRAPGMKSPWPFKETVGYPSDAPGTYRLVAFSRAAFNRQHTQALFAASDSCGSLCGGGGAVIAWRDNGAWQFKPSGCLWQY